MSRSLLIASALLLFLPACTSEAEKQLELCKELRQAGQRDQALEACDKAVEAAGPKWAKEQAAKTGLEMRAEQLEDVRKDMEKTLEKLK